MQSSQQRNYLKLFFYFVYSVFSRIYKKKNQTNLDLFELNSFNNFINKMFLFENKDVSQFNNLKHKSANLFYYKCTRGVLFIAIILKIMHFIYVFL